MTSKRYKLHKRFRPKRSRVKKILKNRFFWFSFLGFLFAGGILYGIFFTPFFQIKHIEIQGNQKIAGEKLQEIAQSRMHHFLFANATGMIEEIQVAFPEIESVAVQKKFPDSLRVQVQERQGVAVWCQQTTSSRECFALDKHGVIFEKKEPERELILSKSDSLEVRVGEKALDPELLKHILSFSQQLDASSLFGEVGLRVSSAVLVSKERVNANISEGWEIYLNPTENIDWQVTKVKLVLEKEIPSGKRPFLEYIDLRFGDQAYIKYRTNQ